jgi:hypothetical protein
LWSHLLRKWKKEDHEFDASKSIKVSETLSQKQTTKQKDWGMAQMVQYKALGSVLSTEKNLLITTTRIKRFNFGRKIIIPR